MVQVGLESWGVWVDINIILLIFAFIRGYFLTTSWSAGAEELLMSSSLSSLAIVQPVKFVVMGGYSEPSLIIDSDMCPNKMFHRKLLFSPSFSIKNYSKQF